MSRPQPSSSSSSGLGLVRVARLPRVVVLDLDYTIWPLYADCSRPSDTPRLYPEAQLAMDAMRASGVVLAAASRTETPDVAKVFLDKLGLTEYFAVCAWGTGPKVSHFETIKRAVGVEYSDMVFFDDEFRNIRDISKLGVFCQLVDDGLTFSVLNSTLAAFDRARSQA